MKVNTSGENSEHLDNGAQRLSPEDMIREELDLRQQRSELTNEHSLLLLKLASLYKIEFVKSKPQMFPDQHKTAQQKPVLAEQSAVAGDGGGGAD